MKIQLIAATALLALVGAVAAPAGAAAPTVELRPGSLDRGDDVAGPHVEGRTLVDGTLRISFRWPNVTLLGTSGTAYVVNVSRTDGTHQQTLRVHRDDSFTVLARGLDSSEVLLSGDGDHLVTTPDAGSSRTTVRVLDARTRAVVDTREFPGYVSVLDADEGRAILGSWGPNRTLWWNFVTDDTLRINNRAGSAASITANRVASYTRDPYNGGCSVVTDLRRPIGVLWRSCDQRVEAFTENGRRIATVHILSDGLGPTEVTVRRTHHGAALARYTAEWFGALRWETNTALLLDTNGRAKAATVRCVGAACERASDLKPVPEY